MATLVLTVVGTALGGPIGGAIGAALGQQVDHAILGGGKGREGPRLKELDVQTSSYGTSIPAIFGAMRVAGTVIWATDLIERKVKSGGGKGRPTTTNYSYSVSIAVALSSRPLARIGRIWADGNLLRGEAGDFKVQTEFRFYNGREDQSADPLIASAEGVIATPAYRGLAYVVFDDLQLADFGNRIPSLTFEIFEREEPVRLADIASVASTGLITGNSAETVTGYALEGRDVRGALSPLFAAMPALLRPIDGVLQLRDWWQNAPASIIKVAANAASQSFDRSMTSLSPAAQIPSSLSIKHYEPARDFQTGIQTSQRSGARRLADLQLLQMQRNRLGWSGHVILDEKPLHIGDWIVDNASSERWRVTELEHLRGVIRVSSIRSIDSDSSVASGVDPGRNLPSPDVSAGQTRVMAIDLPVLGISDPGKPLIAIAASGTMAGWRRSALSLQQGNALLELGATSGPSVMGSAITALGDHSVYFIDDSSILDVELLHEAMIIPAGGGLIWLNGEIIRYNQALYLANKRYRLTKLQRGSFGSESATALHQIGDPFLFLDTDTLRILDDVILSVGQQLTVEALGIGDALAVLAQVQVTGHASLPFSPVHAIAYLKADNAIELIWKRRARIDFGWNDNIDHPVIEESEIYTVAASVSGSPLAAWEVNQPYLAVSATQIAAWQLETGSALTFTIRQIGRHGQSAPTQVVIPKPA